MRFVQRTTFGWGTSGASAAHPREGLVIHYDGSDQGLAGKSHSACIGYWKSTRTFHMGNSRGWADIGYSFGCCPHGFVFEGRGVDRAQAAQPGGNSTWYSCTLMSGPTESPTAEQIDAVRQLRAWLMSKGMGGAVRGHRDFISTSCPGDRLYRLVRDGTFTGSSNENEEEDVSAQDMWQHELPVPYGDKDNPEWQAGNILVNHGNWLRKIDAKLDAQNVTIKALVDALAARDGEIDVEALVDRIETAIGQIKVRLDVDDAAPATP